MTIRDALLSKINYPIQDGVDTFLIDRGMSGDDEYTTDVSKSPEFKGALADCLQFVLIQGVNFSEADKSVSIPTDTRKMLLSYINSLYSSIGEPEVNLGEPTVHIGR